MLTCWAVPRRGAVVLVYPRWAVGEPIAVPPGRHGRQVRWLSMLSPRNGAKNTDIYMKGEGRYTVALGVNFQHKLQCLELGQRQGVNFLLNKYRSLAQMPSQCILGLTGLRQNIAQL